MVWRWEIAQWFELRWWKNYLGKTDKVKYVAWKWMYWRGLLAKIENDVKIMPDKTIADLGCGPAGIFIALPLNKVIAVDPLIDEYEKQTGVFQKSDYPNTTFVETPIEEFNPAGNSKFDIVFCMNAINHVHDIVKGFDKLREICADNGAIVISVDAHNINFFKYLFRLVPADILHPHQYDLTEYEKLLNANGWETTGTYLMKQSFLFDHWVLIAKKSKS